jgi:O-acetyl-ADP-ribose deacetylase (regulator of RNase III)
MKFIKGDLLDLASNGYFDVILHGANIHHVMGAGIAKQIRDKFPEAYIADLATKKGDVSKVGTFSSSIQKCNTNIGTGFECKHFMIINAYTQYSYSKTGDVFSYDGFEFILKTLSKLYPNYKYGLPLIGCGLAGGNKERILKIIEDAIGHMDVTIVEWGK